MYAQALQHGGDNHHAEICQTEPRQACVGLHLGRYFQILGLDPVHPHNQPRAGAWSGPWPLEAGHWRWQGMVALQQLSQRLVAGLPMAGQAPLQSGFVIATGHPDGGRRLRRHRNRCPNRARQSRRQHGDHPALASGMVLMREDGQSLVDQGITSAQELVRITRD